MTRSMMKAVVLVAAVGAGCVYRSTGETEVGVLVCKISLGCAIRFRRRFFEKLHRFFFVSLDTLAA